MKKIITFLIFLLGISYAGKAQFQVGTTTVTPSVLTNNLHVPWELIWGPDNFIWMSERNGRISRVNPQTGTVFPLLILPDVTQTGESGLLGMVLHPNFAQTPHVFVSYTYTKNGSLTEKLVRLTYDGTTLISPLVLIDNINATSIHNGSRLLILPDQTILMTTGDAANASQAQNLNSLSGKILRLNLDGTIPANNPVPGSYVYSLGHRNPQGLLRAPNGIIYSSEHGPNNDDEFNIIEVNRNYGWPNVEGFCNITSEQAFCTTNNVKEPLAVWTPTIAVAGIAYYNHPAIPGWQNQILMATLKGSHLRKLELNAAGTAVVSQTTYLNGTYGRLRSICVSPAGKVYIGTSNGNNTDRIIVLENMAYVPSGLNNAASKEKSFNVRQDSQTGKLTVTFSPENASENLELYDLAGRKLLQKNVPASLNLVIDTNNFPAGMYILKSGKSTQKIAL